MFTYIIVEYNIRYMCKSVKFYESFGILDIVVSVHIFIVYAELNVGCTQMDTRINTFTCICLSIYTE